MKQKKKKEKQKNEKLQINLYEQINLRRKPSTTQGAKVPNKISTNTHAGIRARIHTYGFRSMRYKS